MILIERYPNISMNYLFQGKGNPLNADKTDKEIELECKLTESKEMLLQAYIELNDLKHKIQTK